MALTSGYKTENATVRVALRSIRRRSSELPDTGVVVHGEKKDGKLETTVF